jgi:luciferase family oxidoreductase group 1
VTTGVERLSVLDVMPIAAGSTARQAIANTVDLAQLVDRLGFTRYWLAEHHNAPGMASSSPELMIAHLADHTTTIRVGSGGVMLPNHSALRVAEQFRVLETLHPDRIDLGIGRAPGTDRDTARVLRRSVADAADTFPEQLGELLAFLGDGFPAGHPLHNVRAIPTDAAMVPMWLLSSSGYSAQAAGQLGLGFAWAHHINPNDAATAIRTYREAFEPGKEFPDPSPILAISVVCAPTDEEAEYLAATLDVVFLDIAKGNRDTTLISPEAARAYHYSPADKLALDAHRTRFFVGSPDTIRAKLDELADRTDTPELMVLSMIHDHAARRRSYELLAEVFALDAPA